VTGTNSGRPNRIGRVPQVGGSRHCDAQVFSASHDLGEEPGHDARSAHEDEEGHQPEWAHRREATGTTA